MIPRHVAESLISEMLLPGTEFDITSAKQHDLINKFYMMTDFYADPEIRIVEFDRKMKRLFMDMRNKSQFDRTRAYLGDITELEKTTGVVKIPKRMIQAIQRGVFPLRLRTRLKLLMEAGTTEQKAAYYDINFYKALLRSEAKKDDAAQRLLSQHSMTDFKKTFQIEKE